MRPIDADALWTYIANNSACYHDCCPRASGKKGVLACIDEQPTIEPEVRRGWWIRRETVLDTECKCSVCGYKDFVPKHDNYWFRRKFCPNCGARMDGGAENG